MNDRDQFLRLRAALIEKLRASDARTVAQLEAVDSALSGQPLGDEEVILVANGEFRTLSIAQAMVFYLCRMGGKVTEENLVQALLIGEAGENEPNERDLKWRINQSINYFLAKGKSIRKDDAGNILLADENPAPIRTR